MPRNPRGWLQPPSLSASLWAWPLFRGFYCLHWAKEDFWWNLDHSRIHPSRIWKSNFYIFGKNYYGQKLFGIFHLCKGVAYDDEYLAISLGKNKCICLPNSASYFHIQSSLLFWYEKRTQILLWSKQFSFESSNKNSISHGKTRECSINSLTFILKTPWGRAATCISAS